MLKRDITYENFDGEQETKTFYFNLTATEILDLETDERGSLEERIRRIIEAGEVNALFKEFKELILFAYGVREGDRFVKTEELREAFVQTAAFDALYMELVQDETAAVTFMEGIIPKKYLVEGQNAVKNSTKSDVQLALDNAMAHRAEMLQRASTPTTQYPPPPATSQPQEGETT